MRIFVLTLSLALGLGAEAAMKTLPTDRGQPADERTAQQALPQADTPLWGVLRQTKVGEDAQRGLYTASFPAAVKALDGTNVQLSGFMLPIDAWTRSKHFLLSKYTPVCFFCPPGEPNEVVEVTTAKPVPVTEKLVTLSGKLTMTDSSEKGLFFRIDGGVLDYSR